MTDEHEASDVKAELVSDLDEWHRVVCAEPDLDLELNGKVQVASTTVKLVLLAYRCYFDGPGRRDPGGNAYPDPQLIADQLEVSLSTVERSLRVGLERGLIVRTARAAPGRRATYHASRPSHVTDERPAYSTDDGPTSVDIDANVRRNATGRPPQYLGGNPTTTPSAQEREATSDVAGGGGGDPSEPDVAEVLEATAGALGPKGRTLSRRYLAGCVSELLQRGWSPAALARQMRDELVGADVKRSATKYVEAVLQRLATEPPRSDETTDLAQVEQLLEQFREAVPEAAERQEIRDEALRTLTYRDGNASPDPLQLVRECLAIAEAVPVPVAAAANR